MINQFKTAPLIVKLIVGAGLCGIAVVLCGLAVGAAFLTLRPVTQPPPLPMQGAAPAPSPNEAAGAVAPSSPTATPPGEEITDPNYLQAKASLSSQRLPGSFEADRFSFAGRFHPGAGLLVQGHGLFLPGGISSRAG
ncbi:MAG TPA: hypothetical protein VEC93_18100, partial [Anaerolineae bacterium]|nr:hypothetical protein [Anaerolineae bacterium]